MSEKCYVVRRHYFNAKVVECRECSLSEDIDPFTGSVAVCDEAGVVLLVDPAFVFSTREAALLKAAVETKRFRHHNRLWMWGTSLALLVLFMVKPIAGIIGFLLLAVAIWLTMLLGSDMD